jgi:HK97 gp10 family phage protein
VTADWRGDEFLRAMEKQLADNLEKAAVYFKGQVKDKINRSEPYTRYVGDHGIYYTGQDPSAPGEEPKKITGTLQRSITHRMSEDRRHAFVGSNIDYAAYLEMGTSKMAARPYLRSTLIEESDVLVSIVTTGKK